MVPGWPAECQRRAGQPVACPRATDLRCSSLARDILLKLITVFSFIFIIKRIVKPKREKINEEKQSWNGGINYGFSTQC